MPATIENAEEIAMLVNSAYRGDSSRQGWTTEADFLDGQRTSAEQIRQILNDPRQALLILRSPGNSAIDGCVALENTDRPATCYLGMLTVKPGVQARGIGRFLLEAAEKFAAKNWNCGNVILGVIQIRESLIAWYERRGYKKTGETKPFPYGDEQFGIPKRDDLYFVFLEKSIRR